MKNLIESLSDGARKVLHDNHLDQRESLYPWIWGDKHDFPTEDITIQHELDEFIIELRKQLMPKTNTSSITDEPPSRKSAEGQPVTNATEKVVSPSNNQIQQYYNRLLESNRFARRFVDSNEDLLDIGVVFQGIDNNEFSPKYFRDNRNTTKGYMEFLKVINLISAARENGGETPSQISTRPFVNDPFVNQYYKGNEHYPFFFILGKYLEELNEDAGNKRNDKIFSEFYGVSQVGVPMSPEDIAKKYRICKESARNIARNRARTVFSSDLNNILESCGKPYYPLLQRNCIFDIENDNECKTIRSQENDISNNVIIASLALMGYEIEYIYKDNQTFKSSYFYPQTADEVKTLAVRNKLAGFKFNKVLNDIKDGFDRGNGLNMSLTDFIMQKNYWQEDMPDLDDNEKESISATIAQMIKTYLPDVNTEDDRIIIPARNFNASDIEEILTAGGNTTPMECTVILEELRRKYPGDKRLNDMGRLRNVISKNKQQFKLIGKSGRLKMTEWPGNDQCIPDVVRDILRKAKEPLTSKQVTETVKEIIGDRFEEKNTKNSIGTELGRHLSLEKSDDWETYYMRCGREDYDHNIYSVKKKKSEWTFVDYVRDFERFCKIRNRLPGTSNNGEPARNQFFKDCIEIKKYIDEYGSYPPTIDNSPYKINELRVVDGKEILCELIEFAKQYKN